jgi:preprotein translocase subunit SecY
MGFFDTLFGVFPSVSEPKAHLNFKSRLKWTGLILLIYLILGQITLFGITPAAKERFQFLELVLGASMGTLITLGIGPIVTASIILQLLVGSKILPWDLRSPEGKKKFQGMQKLLTLFFCIFEAYAFVAFGAIQPASPTAAGMLIVMVQLAFGGFLVLMMDEVVSKWGIGSGVSLFIAAGVSKGIFVRAFNPITPMGESVPIGLIPQFIVLLGMGELFQAAVALLPILSTIIVFLIVVYAQAMKVEIPLAFGAIRGFSTRWPLNLIYTSNIPIILMAALIANMQLIGGLMAHPTDMGTHCGILGCFDSQGTPTSGFAYYLYPSRELSIQVFFITFLSIVFFTALAAFFMRYKNIGRVIMLSVAVGLIVAFLAMSSLVGLPAEREVLRTFTYMLAMVIGSVVFSIFWVATSGMDARSVAEQIEGIGMQVPGFRRDPRIVEQVLNRYIPMLAIISGAFLGVLASFADFTGALGTGTGILLTVMIIYNLYEQIATRYVEDMNPALRRFFR